MQKYIPSLLECISIRRGGERGAGDDDPARRWAEPDAGAGGDSGQLQSAAQASWRRCPPCLPAPPPAAHAAWRDGEEAASQRRRARPLCGGPLRVQLLVQLLLSAATSVGHPPPLSAATSAGLELTGQAEARAWRAEARAWRAEPRARAALTRLELELRRDLGRRPHASRAQGCLARQTG